MSPITLRRPPGGTPTSTRARRVRTLSFATVISLFAALLSLTGIATAAQAAPGDYTVSLSAPPTVQLGSTYNYVATVDFEGVNSSSPSSGVVLTTTLPEGTEFISVPEGPSEVVASHTYDPVTRVLTLTLNDTTQDLVSVAYTVGQVDQVNKYQDFPLDATIGGTGGPSGPVSSQPVQTLVKGLNDFNPLKGYTVLTGGDNRTVTYNFNAYVPLEDIPQTFWAHAQEFTDVFPAGAQLVSTSSGFGTWDTSAFPTVVWTKNTVYTPSGNTLDPSASAISITVRYPDVPGWEAGATPPVNTVSLRTQDANGTWYDQGTATTQSLPFMPGDGPHLSVSKTSQYGNSAGMLGRDTYLNAAYVADSGDPDIDQLILTDSGATGQAAEAWFHHNFVHAVSLDFNGVLQAAALPYTFEYQTNWSSAWQTYVPVNATTAADANIRVFNDGSSGWGGTDNLVMPVGQLLTGWRVTIAPGAETVPPASEIRTDMGTEPVFRDLAQNILPSIAPTPVTSPPAASPGPVNNEGSVSDGTTTLTADNAYTPVDSLYLTTRVSAPVSMSVGGTGTYTAGIINQNPSETYADAKMSVVLPCGVFYDPSQPITPLAPTLGVPTPPTIGAGASVDTTQRVLDADGCEQQVITFTFDEIAPMRQPGTATDRGVENTGWRYTIPVTVLAQAYDPNDTAVPVTSYAYTDDPRFRSVTDGGTNPQETVPIRGYGGFIGDDNYNFDQFRDQVGTSNGITTINTGGGLLISKLSAASAEGPWGLRSEVGTEAFWQVYVSDILPNPVSNLTFFDKLPSTADGDAFSVTLSGAVTGAPAGATVEYSTDATSGDTGTWGTDPIGATAFRVVLAQMLSGDNFTLTVPTAVEGTPDYGDVSDNVVTSSATYGNSVFTAESNLAEVYVGATADIDIVKKTNNVDVPDASAAPVVPAGSVVQWTYEVTNNGTTTLDDVTVTDVGGPDGGTVSDVTVTAPAGFSGSLAPGESVVFTATGLAIAGLYNNVAVTTGTPVDDEGNSIPIDAPTATDESWYTGDASGAGIAIVKKTNGVEVNGSSEAPKVLEGGDVEWTYEVTNIGTVILDDVTVSDVGGAVGGTPAGVTVTAPSGFTGTLAPGESVVFTATGTAIAGLYHNVAVTTGVPVNSDGDPVDITPPTATDESWYTGDPLAPGIVIVKKTNGKVVDTSTAAPQVAPGSTVNWTFEVTNTGNTVLDDVTVTDVGGPATGTGSAVTVSAPSGFDGSLAPGETVIFTASGTAISGLYHNVAVVVGTPLDGSDDPVETVSGTDESWYTGTVAAAVVTNVVLAFTGLGTNSIIWAALSLLIIGGALMWVRTRERRASQNG